jgi:hypothetical protein
MYSANLAIALFACVNCALFVAGQDRTYDRLNTANVAEKNGAKLIDANFGGSVNAEGKVTDPERARLSAMQNRVNLALQNAKLQAQTADGTANAVLNDKKASAIKTDAGVQANQGTERVAASSLGNGRVQAAQGTEHKALGQLIKDGETVQGGMAQQGANRGNMKTQEGAADLVANNRFKANGRVASGDVYNAQTVDQQSGAQGQYGLKSQTLTEDGGNGLIMAKNGKGAGQYNYQLTDNNDGTSDVSLNKVGSPSGAFAPKTDGWKCTAVKDGESICRDSNGKIVGKVMTNAKGDATVVDKNGVAVGRGKINKISDEKYEVVIMEGLALAKTERIQTYDCFAEIQPGKSQEKKIVIENTKVVVDGEVQTDGSKTFSWPTCFDIVGDITVPAGVDPARLAFEYVGHVMPMGNMKCMDSMTCGRDCYYCNACQKQKLIGDATDLLVSDNQICSLHGGEGKQTVSMRVCPPAEMEVGVLRWI